MDALRAGGLDAAWHVSRDIELFKRNRIFDPPAPGTVYELKNEEFDRREFPRMYDGKLIKVLRKKRVLKMAVMPGGIRIVMMRRRVEEISASFFAWYRVSIREDVETDLQYAAEMLKNRRDVISFNEIWYREIIQAPLQYFNDLANAGWPIDAEQAAAVVDMNKCNFRIEDMVPDRMV